MSRPDFLNLPNFNLDILILRDENHINVTKIDDNSLVISTRDGKSTQ